MPYRQRHGLLREGEKKPLPWIFETESKEETSPIVPHFKKSSLKSNYAHPEKLVHYKLKRLLAKLQLVIHFQT